MPIEPYNWNAVVTGFWNLAILSPDGIRSRLFELAPGTPVEVEVAVDRPGPYRVKHNGLIVVPTNSRLEVLAEACDAESIIRACALCRRALASLPETPVTAAGINIRYRLPEIPDAVIDLVRAPLDNAISDAGHTVTAARTRRTLPVPPGVVNVQIGKSGTAGTLEFNFHRESPSPSELGVWLERIVEFLELSERLAAVAGVPNVRREDDNA
jgi:hypothetical protein